MASFPIISWMVLSKSAIKRHCLDHVGRLYSRWDTNFDKYEFVIGLDIQFSEMSEILRDWLPPFTSETRASLFPVACR